VAVRAGGPPPAGSIPLGGGGAFLHGWVVGGIAKCAITGLRDH